MALCGMVDADELSSWYMLCAPSLHPFSATDAEYTVMAPLLDKVTKKANTGKLLTIKKPRRGQTLTTIQVNGKETKGYFVSHDLFKNRGTLEIITK
nr:glycoside hydrolase domain-containing protein [Spirosoma liriopis]